MRRIWRRLRQAGWGCLLIVWLPTQPAIAVSPLAGDPSPYLAMHADDPVAWRPLDETALRLARELGRPLLVSVGYFSCYWCHVMQRESFRDPAVAAQLNDGYLPVLVDRELNPALDALLIEFVQRTRGRAGWPLNVVLTPEGYPLFGATYLPRERFLELLQRLRALWATERAELAAAAREQAATLDRPRYDLAGEYDPGYAAAYGALLVEVILRESDPLAGGFGDQNKFPSVPQLVALLSLRGAAGGAAFDPFLLLTLDRMADQGLRDQLGGGFFRYTVDPQWQVPHFEKMLYDNAQLAQLYLRAATVFDRPAYRAIAFDTLDFVLAALARGDGSYAASLSAVDEHGVEGAYYLWSDSELQTLLSASERQLVDRAWGWGEPASIEGGRLPTWRDQPAAAAAALGLDPDTAGSRLEAIGSRLLDARRQRTVPRDGKPITGWNGLLLSALAEAMQQPGGARFGTAAQALRDALWRRAWNGATGSLHRLIDRERRLPGQLDDYAYVAAGLLAWATGSGAEEDYRNAAAVAQAGFDRFFDRRGWRVSERPLLPIELREAAVPDGALPSPSATLLAVALELADRDVGSALAARGLWALNVPHDVLLSGPFWYATQIATTARFGLR